MYLCIYVSVYLCIHDDGDGDNDNDFFPQSRSVVVSFFFAQQQCCCAEMILAPTPGLAARRRDHGVPPCGSPREYPWRPPHGSQAVARTLLPATTIGQSSDSGTAHTWRALPLYPDRRPRPTHPRNSSTAYGRASSSLDAGASVELEQQLVSGAWYSLFRKYIKPSSILEDKNIINSCLSSDFGWTSLCVCM